MSDVVRLFGARADAYASFRPHYPATLFDWLAANSPDHNPLREPHPRLGKTWPDPGQRRFVRWPLHFLAGLPNNTHQ